MKESLTKIFNNRAARLITAGAILLPLGGQACAQSNHESAGPTNSIGATLEKPESEILFESLYPEFKKLGIQARETIYIDPEYTDSDVPTEVVNYTDFKLDTKVINEFYRIFEFYAGERLEMPGGLGDPNQKIIVTGTNNSKVRSFIFIPENAPRPFEDRLPREETSAATLSIEGLEFSFVRVQPSDFEGFKTYQENTTLSAATEVCQQLLHATLVDASGQEIDEGMIKFSQEVICNSLGIAVASKALGYSYSQYETFLRNHGVANYSPLSLDEQVYSAFSTHGTVLK